MNEAMSPGHYGTKKKKHAHRLMATADGQVVVLLEVVGVGVDTHDPRVEILVEADNDGQAGREGGKHKQTY